MEEKMQNFEKNIENSAKNYELPYLSVPEFEAILLLAGITKSEYCSKRGSSQIGRASCRERV